MTDRLTTFLWFDRGQARQAAELYVRTFPDSHLGGANTAASDYPGGSAGDELTVEFTLMGRPFTGLNGGPDFTPNESVSFMVVTADQEETDRYWDALVADGGEESQCGWCKDPWGFSWQITPQVLLDGLSHPDPATAKRVMDAMMTMQRIDIATIEAALAGD